MNGYNRIKEQYLALTEKEDALKKITLFLMKQPNSALYLNEDKNLTAMMDYIKKLAKEKAVNNVAVIDEATVYNWAMDYFSKSDNELGIEKSGNIKSKTQKESSNSQLKLELESCT